MQAASPKTLCACSESLDCCAELLSSQTRRSWRRMPHHPTDLIDREAARVWNRGRQSHMIKSYNVRSNCDAFSVCLGPVDRSVCFRRRCRSAPFQTASTCHRSTQPRPAGRSTLCCPRLDRRADRVLVRQGPQCLCGLWIASCPCQNGRAGLESITGASAAALRSQSWPRVPTEGTRRAATIRTAIAPSSFSWYARPRLRAQCSR